MQKFYRRHRHHHRHYYHENRAQSYIVVYYSVVDNSGENVTMCKIVHKHFKFF